MIETRELTKIYEDGTVGVIGLNINVSPGEIFVMLGANGAGKTTTINLLLGFIEPTSGTALINGIDVFKNPIDAKRYVAYVPEVVELYRNLTVRQNMDFFAKLGGKGNLKDKDYAEALERVGLSGGLLRTRAKNLSKGMKQRVVLAMAIIKDAPAMIMDEPTVGLDPQGASEFLQILRQLRDEGKAILMSSHDIFRAKQVADRVGILVRGRLIKLLTSEEIAKEDLERLYLDYVEAYEVTP